MKTQRHQERVKKMAEKLARPTSPKFWDKMAKKHKKMFDSPDHIKRVAEGSAREARDRKYDI